VAVQLNALEVSGKLTLTATTVLNLMPLGTDEEDDPGQSVDRAFWAEKSSTQAMAVLDKLHKLVQAVTGNSDLLLKYNKAYVGLSRHGVADNFITFRPRKTGHVLTDFRLERDDDLMSRIEEAGLDVAAGFKTPGRLYIRLTNSDLENSEELVRELIGRAAETYQSTTVAGQAAVVTAIAPEGVGITE
jgi:hypothetical protein